MNSSDDEDVDDCEIESEADESIKSSEDEEIPENDEDEIMDLDHEDDVEDEEVHKTMLSNIFSKTGLTKKKKTTRSYVEDTVSAEDSKARQLLHLKDGQKSELIKQTRRIERRAKLLDAPDDLVDAKASRIAGFEANRKNVDAWKGIVEQNRLSDQLVFPLNNDSVKMSETQERTLKNECFITATLKKAVVAQNDSSKKMGLDAKLYALLYPNKLKKATKVDVDEVEADNVDLEEEAEALSDQVHERARIRAREAFLEAKLKRQKKIKSKSYHRHLKRRKLKIYEKETEELKETDPEAFAERLKEIDKLRVVERASQRHKMGGKFAKAQRLRAKYDDNAREAVQLMLEKSKELSKKRGPTIGDSSSDDDEEEAPDVRTEADKEMERRELLELNDWGEERDSRQSSEQIDKTPKGKVTDKDGLGKTKKVVCSVVNHVAVDAMLGEEDEEGNPLNPMEAAFFHKLEAVAGQEGEELAEEFRKEKEAVVEAEKPKDIDLFIPGWNSWTGPGLERMDAKKRTKFLHKAPEAKRKDDNKSHVIIRSSLHPEFKKHLVKTIPFPYQTPEQFEAAICKPLGREWNTETSHQDFIKKRVVTKAGQIIKPIDKHNSLLKTKQKARIH